MADIRIKDLTTTASSTASDDFIAVDGTTNGTRKLSAFSPTFGGNATVTGTLSSGGNLSVTGTSAQVILGQSSGSQLTYLIRPAQAGGAIQMVQDSATANRWLSLGISDNLGVYSELMRVAGATGNILIPGTVASTTTSTGALVVSGGLGVAGNINGGGDITLATNTKAFYNLSFATAKGLTAGYFSRGTSGGWGAGLHFYSSNTDYSATFAHDPSTGDFHLYTTSSASNYTSSEIALTATAAKQIKVLSSTASTSTSSGALVVSGGVGVAGSVFASGFVHPGGDNSFYVRGTGSANGLIRGNVVTADVVSNFRVRNGDGTTEYLDISSTGFIAAIPATAPSLTVNGTMTFERTSNTSLKISVRGTDGTTRSVSLTLA